MPTMMYPTTNTASTQDWLQATKNMRISAYDSALTQSQLKTEETNEPSPLFGTHIKEAIEIVKDWIEDK